MAGKTKDMSKIKQVIRMHLNGLSNRKIASSIDINKETVNNYLRKAKSNSIDLETLLLLDDPILEHQLKGGSPAYSDERLCDFMSLLPYFVEQMKTPHVTLQLLWEEYIVKHPKGYRISQFRYHYRQNTIAQRKTSTTLLKDMYMPGEKLFVDFAGDTMEYIDIETGEVIKVQVFVACLPKTDYGFAIAVPSQRSEDFIAALEACFNHLGGAPKILVPDNLKAAVIKTDRYEPTINKTLEEFANHYGCVVLPARVGKPKDKSLVENHVKLIYQRVYAPFRNRVFHSLQELNEAITQMMKAHNQKRMQQHNFTREEHFVAVEKHTFKPLPADGFEIKHYTKLKVQDNSFVYLGRDKRYFSVPKEYVHKDVEVIYTRSLIKIYASGQCIASHSRAQGAKYVYNPEHLPSQAQHYRQRSSSSFIEKASKLSPLFGALVAQMFQNNKYPEEVLYKGCQGLFQLQRHSEPVLFNEACNIAISIDRCNYKTVDRLIKTNCAGYINMQTTADLSPKSNHQNIRGKQSYV